MSTEKIYKATISQIIVHVERDGEREYSHLDIGSGTGELIQRLKGFLDTKSSCCDYTDQLMKLPNQQVDIVDLNSKKALPYKDNSFEIVTATEVIEHLEDFRAVLREIYRILKPGGICVITTPNILNLNSRLRNLWFGFAVLMSPLSIKNRTLESCAGHINPVSLFYIMHSLSEIDFKGVDFTIDKYQRSGFGKAVFLFLPIKLFGSIIWLREKYKHKTIDSTNEEIVRSLNSVKVLLGRTVIVSAKK